MTRLKDICRTPEPQGRYSVWILAVYHQAPQTKGLDVFEVLSKSLFLDYKIYTKQTFISKEDNRKAVIDASE